MTGFMASRFGDWCRVWVFLGLLLGVAGCAGPVKQEVKAQPALDAADCASRVGDSERYLAATVSPETELVTAAWVSYVLAEVMGRCPGLEQRDAILLRLGNAAFVSGSFWLAGQAYAALARDYPTSDFNFEDVGGRRARLLDRCAHDIVALDALRMGLLQGRYGGIAEARRYLTAAGRSNCLEIAAYAREVAEGL